MNNCLQCNCLITESVRNFSINEFGVPLCMEHQNWVRNLDSTVTDASLRLYFALKNRGIPVQLEKWDGYKHIDMAIPQAKLNIEVDGIHHSRDARQAIADLRRTYHSFAKGYYTIRIPNVLTDTEYHLEQTADAIADFFQESMRRKW